MPSRSNTTMLPVLSVVAAASALLLVGSVRAFGPSSAAAYASHRTSARHHHVVASTTVQANANSIGGLRPYRARRQYVLLVSALQSSPDDQAPGNDHTTGAPAQSSGKKVAGGDQLRASTGIRPSLHPTTINAISEALLLRHSPKNTKAIDIWSPDNTPQPLEVAVTAGALSSDLLEKRKDSCVADGDVGSIPTPEECQAVAGRVVGVVMRLRQLEVELAEKVNTAKWVAKYGEYDTFGVLKSECQKVANDIAASTSSSTDEIEIDPTIEKELTDKIRDDPLFRMCRAECLLALFLDTVEAPKLQEVGETVPGGSSVDFIDEDRREVILS